VTIAPVTLIGMRITAEASAIDGSADRRVVGCRDGLDAGQAAKGFNGLIEEESGARPIVARHDAAAMDINAGEEQVIRSEAKRLMQQNLDAGNHPSGRGDEHESERDLRGDKDAAGTLQAGTGGSVAAALSEVDKQGGP